MAKTIQQGYIGIVEFPGINPTRCSDFGVNVDQEFGTFDHIIGLNDTVPLTSSTKGEAVGVIQTQKTFVRPMPLMIQGSMSLPADIASLNYLFDKIKTGAYIDSFNFYYYCDYGRKFTDVRLNSFSFSITAGDTLNITVGFAAKGLEEIPAAASTHYKDAVKLVTWDTVSITVNDADFSSNDLLKEFSLDVSNPITPIYTAQPDNDFSDLAPHDLRIGMQEVSGVLSFYLEDGIDKLPDCFDPALASTIDIVVGGGGGNFTQTVNVLLLPKKTTGSVGPVVSTIGYIGIDKAFGA